VRGRKRKGKRKEEKNGKVKRKKRDERSKM
jgi:hypothetical protein